MQNLPIIKPGQRVIAAGRTGSGKSVWAKWMLQRSPLTWIILNPKHTAAYNDLPNSMIVKSLSMQDIEKGINKGFDYIIVNPGSHEAQPDSLDAFIMGLHDQWQSIGLCCDELYTLHKAAVAGPGLIGWLTRGRELKQSFLGLTQRPAWLTQFLFSESDYICSLSLSLEKDKKRMVEMTGQDAFNSRIPPHHWLWYSVGTEQLNYYGPVPLSQN